MDGLRTEVCGQQKQSNDPRNNQHNLQYANYWAPLTRKRHTMPHSAQSQHTNHWTPRPRKRHQQEHRPQRPTKRSDPTRHAKGRTGDRPGPRKETTTRRNVTQGGRQESSGTTSTFTLDDIFGPFMVHKHPLWMADPPTPRRPPAPTRPGQGRGAAAVVAHSRAPDPSGEPKAGSEPLGLVTAALPRLRVARPRGLCARLPRSAGARPARARGGTRAALSLSAGRGPGRKLRRDDVPRDSEQQRAPRHGDAGAAPRASRRRRPAALRGGLEEGAQVRPALCRALTVS